LFIANPLASNSLFIVLPISFFGLPVPLSSNDIALHLNYPAYYGIYRSAPHMPKAPKALFVSWVSEGRGREGKAYGEVNPCLGVLKK